jgi:hypothetical protein
MVALETDHSRSVLDAKPRGRDHPLLPRLPAFIKVLLHGRSAKPHRPAAHIVRGEKENNRFSWNRKRNRIDVNMLPQKDHAPWKEPALCDWLLAESRVSGA